MKIEKEVYEETGEHTIYTVNVTDRLPRMFDLAKRCIDAGVNGMMVNYLAVGPEAMRALADDPNINVPILAHMDVAGAFFMSPYQGISSPHHSRQDCPALRRGLHRAALLHGREGHVHA